MIYVATCPQCGLVVRTENPNGEAACSCRVPVEVIPEEVSDGGV
jgi:hypothetical protein